MNSMKVQELSSEDRHVNKVRQDDCKHLNYSGLS
jgi:hypothetical protein